MRVSKCVWILMIFHLGELEVYKTLDFQKQLSSLCDYFGELQKEFFCIDLFHKKLSLTELVAIEIF
jgi:hypothetical protein